MATRGAEAEKKVVESASKCPVKVTGQSNPESSVRIRVYSIFCLCLKHSSEGRLHCLHPKESAFRSGKATRHVRVGKSLSVDRKSHTAYSFYHVEVHPLRWSIRGIPSLSSLLWNYASCTYCTHPPRGVKVEAYLALRMSAGP